MLRFSFLSLAALALLLVIDLSTKAQSVRSFFVERSSSGLSARFGKTQNEVTTIDVPMPPFKIKHSGLITSRLSPKEVERWKNLTRLVFASGKDGAPRYPLLRELWEWADNSGHVVYVQLRDDNFIPSSTAGSINIEQFDPTGKRHIAVLKLCLSNIDQAIIAPRAARANGFIPFLELKKEERYAEVLGHELAHIKYVLSNLLRAYLVHELIQTTNGLLLEQARQKPALLLAREMKERLSQRDTLLRELESQAEAVEELVWQELSANKKSRTGFLTAMSLRQR